MLVQHVIPLQVNILKEPVPLLNQHLAMERQSKRNTQNQSGHSPYSLTNQDLEVPLR